MAVVGYVSVDITTVWSTSRGPHVVSVIGPGPVQFSVQLYWVTKRMGRIPSRGYSNECLLGWPAVQTSLTYGPQRAGLSNTDVSGSGTRGAMATSLGTRRLSPCRPPLVSSPSPSWPSSSRHFGRRPAPPLRCSSPPVRRLPTTSVSPQVCRGGVIPIQYSCWCDCRSMRGRAPRAGPPLLTASSSPSSGARWWRWALPTAQSIHLLPVPVRWSCCIRVLAWWMEP
jgi:hypothetical protein